MIQIVDLPKPHATFSFSSSSALLKTHSLAKYEREGILKYFLKHYHRIEEGGRNLSFLGSFACGILQLTKVVQNSENAWNLFSNFQLFINSKGSSCYCDVIEDNHFVVFFVYAAFRKRREKVKDRPGKT